MKKSIIYIRTSTEQQTPQLQLRDIQTMLPPEGSVIMEEQISAWKENVERQQFTKLLKEIRQKRVANIYVWSLDRIYRHRKRLIEFFQLCKAYKVKIYSFNQKWLEDINNVPDPWGDMVYDMMIQVIAWMGEDESKTKSNRVKMAVKKSDAGTYSHYGKKWGRKSFPPQTIRRVLDLKDSGKSIREIASMVQVYDKSNNGRAISKSAVHKILAQNTQEKGSKNACTQIDQLVDETN